MSRMPRVPRFPYRSGGTIAARPRPPRTPEDFTLLATIAACPTNLEAVLRLLGVPAVHAYLLMSSDTGLAFFDWLYRELPDVLARFRPAADIEAEPKTPITPLPDTAEVPSAALPTERPERSE